MQSGKFKPWQVAVLLFAGLSAAQAGADDNSNTGNTGHENALLATSPGSLSLGYQHDDADGDSKLFALDVPLGVDWLLSIGLLDAANQPNTVAGSPRVATETRTLSLSGQGDGLSAGINLLQYQDGSVLKTDEVALSLRYQGDRHTLRFELMQRQHDVAITLPARVLNDSFDSRGVGADFSFDVGADGQLYGGLQVFDYDDTLLFDTTFQRLLVQAEQYPALRERLLRSYSAATSQQFQAQGSLVSDSWWLGFGLPLADHWLAVEHYASTAEVDGSEYSTDVLLLGLTLNEQWALDITAGVNRDAVSSDIAFAGLTLHWFW